MDIRIKWVHGKIITMHETLIRVHASHALQLKCVCVCVCVCVAA